MPKLDGFFSSCKHAFSISLDLLYLYSTGVASTHISVYITIVCHIHAYTMPKRTKQYWSQYISSNTQCDRSQKVCECCESKAHIIQELLLESYRCKEHFWLHHQVLHVFLYFFWLVCISEFLA